ncbi:MAG: hypothetical protein ABR954_05970 [Dehalococcoidales bacterium]
MKYNLPMKLVYEDKDGAYSGGSPEFLKKFISKENNPNFEVYDSRDNNNRFIAVRSSRLPDDQDLTTNRYGINFHRAKPELQEALQYGEELPYAMASTKWLANTAFAATTEEEYGKKSSVWEHFYSYIWGLTPQTIWVTPHSGSVARVPDEILPYPKVEMDSFTAGIAASCAFNDRSKALKRIMISIHSHSWLGAILDLGGFGIIGDQQLALVAKKIEGKYHERAQILADEYKHDFFLTATRWLEHINNKKGTLNPEELSQTSTTFRYLVGNIVKGLRLYGQEINEFTFTEFKEAIKNLSKIEVPVISSNYLFSAKHVGKLLRLSEKIGHGQLHSALQIECLKTYLARDPELIANIILDIKNELFG